MSLSRATSARGFTLLELMIVVLIMGTVLLLVPANLGNLGARGALNGTANSLVAAFNGARERAILDSYELVLELGKYRDREDDWRYGWRFQFTNVPSKGLVDENDPAAQQDLDTARAQEREWLYTPWHPTQEGVIISGVSDRKGTWQKLGEGGRPYAIRFFADGNVEKGVAVRLESEELDVSRENRTVTVIINPLTSEPSWREGEQELKEARPASDFGN